MNDSLEVAGGPDPHEINKPKLGAPGPDFRTWEATNLIWSDPVNGRWPTSDHSKVWVPQVSILRIWDTSKLNLLGKEF
jgi:hypothetical protein